MKDLSQEPLEVMTSVTPDGKTLMTFAGYSNMNNQARAHRKMVRKYLSEHGLWTLPEIDWREDSHG